MAKILVSACLLGCPTRYDGASKPSDAVLALAKDNVLIPVCPEQLGGLSTPRLPSERTPDGTKVMAKNGTDVTEQYMRGAETAKKLADLNQVDYCILKAGSPACGSGLIYDGSFTGKKVEGNGVAAELLKKNGFKVISEEDLAGK